MAYKNWDDVRNHRVYAYLNQEELDLFMEAMRLKDIKQQATAARTFLIEHSKYIVNQHSMYYFPTSSDFYQ